MKLYDISPPITSELAVFPMDTPMTREVLLDTTRGDNLTLSTIHSTVHLGAHVDGHNHYSSDGLSVGELPIELFVGPCQVIDASPGGRDRVEIADLAEAVDEERVLLRTGTYPDPEHWCEFAGLGPALVDHLHAKGVKLVGVDVPSVDPPSSKDLPAHARCLAGEVTILEGLVLHDVPSGRYELIALPLRLMGFDGSPVRAVLRGE